ncbi:MAG: phage antirepressor [Carnobacterium inhibens]|uniref:phage antirepressor n=1 Tax=Carnobacterium sp. TaxID=48221 RepID=UPI0033151995
MSNIKIFNFEQQNVRTQIINDEPWFVGKDVAEILGYSETNAMTRRLEEEDFISTKLSGMNMNSLLINESGLYTAVIGSKLPSAKKFKRWVTTEVLPTIRKHGAYMTPEKIEQVLLNPDTIIQLATNLKDEQQKRLVAEAKIEAQKPKVVFAEAVEVSQNSVAVKILATVLKQNGIDIGQNRMFQWLRDNKYISSRPGGSWNMPTQKSMDQGLFELKPNTYFNNGISETKYTPLVTGKGQIYFINKFKSQGVLQ